MASSKPGSVVLNAKPYWPYTKVNGKQLDYDVHLAAPIVKGETIEDLQGSTKACYILPQTQLMQLLI